MSHLNVPHSDTSADTAPKSFKRPGRPSGVVPAMALFAILGSAFLPFLERRQDAFDPQKVVSKLSDVDAAAVRNLVTSDARTCIQGRSRNTSDVTQKLRTIMGDTVSDIFVSCGQYSHHYVFSATTSSGCDKTSHTYRTDDGEEFRHQKDTTDSCDRYGFPRFTF